MLQMALDAIRIPRQEDKIEKEGADSLLLGEIVEHAGDLIVGLGALDDREGGLMGSRDGPDGRGDAYFFRRGGCGRGGEAGGRGVGDGFLALGLSADGFGLIAKDEVEAGDVAGAFAFCGYALAAGRFYFVTLKRRKCLAGCWVGGMWEEYLDLSFSAVGTASTGFSLVDHYDVCIIRLPLTITSMMILKIGNNGMRCFCLKLLD